MPGFIAIGVIFGFIGIGYLFNAQFGGHQYLPQPTFEAIVSIAYFMLSLIFIVIGALVGILKALNQQAIQISAPMDLNAKTKCAKCGKQYDADATSCPACGYSTNKNQTVTSGDTWTCKQCGLSVKNNVIQCPGCGGYK